ncbi:3-methyladenine DNA glycosylase AlkC [Polynucleobacter sphagniphilus]|nr:3-methyladenine DNA glycosylase AlkC [Polynucleobacter sphagniphilus]
MREMLKKTVKPPKKTLDDLLKDKSIITDKEVIHNLKELEKQKKQFEESVEDELRNRRSR